MQVPVIGFCHSGNPNYMVIDVSNRMIVVSELGRTFCFQRDDLGKVPIHSQSSHSNFSLALIPQRTFVDSWRDEPPLSKRDEPADD